MSGLELTTEDVDFTRNEAYDVLNIGVSQSQKNYRTVIKRL